MFSFLAAYPRHCPSPDLFFSWFSTLTSFPCFWSVKKRKWLKVCRETEMQAGLSSPPFALPNLFLYCINNILRERDNQTDIVSHLCKHKEFYRICLNITHYIFLELIFEKVEVILYKNDVLWVACSVNVAKITSFFRSVYSVSFRVSQPYSTSF